MTAALGAKAAVTVTVFVRDLVVQAQIGVYAHEHGRTQPLIIAVETGLTAGSTMGLADTYNYEHVVAHAQRLAAGGHIDLVETFAQSLALACLDHPRAMRVRVRVEKPQALPGEAVAGVEVTVERG